MIQTAIDYAKELHKAGMTHEELSSVKDIFDVVPQVKEELNDPTVSLEKKHLVIQKVFSKNVRNFLLYNNCDCLYIRQTAYRKYL